MGDKCLFMNHLLKVRSYMPLSIEEARYRHGVSDGVRMAIDILAEARNLKEAREASNLLLLESTEITSRSAYTQMREFLGKA